tara:strand:+ start:1150 stop:2076 length:927 start_codon:yes stop_codon:yes gene_type:complete
MYFFVSDKEHNRYSFRSRGTLLLENMDSTNNGLITDTNQIQHNDNRLFVFGKKFTNEILNVLIEKNAKFICDISDYKFYKQDVIDLYTKAAKHCKFFVATCEYLAKDVERLFKAKCYVIADLTERKQSKPIKKVFNKNDVVKLVCYGARKNIHKVNFDMILANMQTVHPNVQIDVVTNKNVDDPSWWTDWSFETQEEMVNNSDAILLPIFYKNKIEKFVKGKGNNRPIDALQQGKFVITQSYIPSYVDLQDYIWTGNLTAGFQYFIHNPNDVYQKVLAGQAHITKYYTPIKVVDKWLELERIINEKSS